MKKSDLRKKYNHLRDELDVKDIEKHSRKILENTLKLDIWDKKLYHIFLTMKNKKEIDTSIFIEHLWNKNKMVSTSVSNFENNTLKNYLFTKETKVETNSWGIPEPIDSKLVNDKNIDVVFIPLLAFDKQGYRVGYGKGFYDRFLANCKPNVIKVGISFFGIENKIEDVNNDDVKMDYCVTPNEIVEFSNS